MRSEPSDARSDGSEVCSTVLRTPLNNTIPNSTGLMLKKKNTFTGIYVDLTLLGYEVCRLSTCLQKSSQKEIEKNCSKLIYRV
ncbi:hypothetical protein RHMOL_Rhmol12G0023000 [Rhododendron molle]|nr:hypothetical protein RHMOL_Rhmol12G0023000 [Rhododendron molle]